MATTSAGLGLEEISSKLNANGRKKRIPKTVEETQQMEESEDILRYGGSGKGRKFLYGVASAIVGENNAKKIAKKYGNREEQEKAFKNIYGEEKKPSRKKTTEQIPKSELKEYLEELKKALGDIAEIKDIVERIEKRISPRDVTLGKGVQAQTYRFDPLAPLEKQVTEVNESGLAGSFAGKKETASVLSKAAYFGNQDLVAKKEKEDLKKGLVPSEEKKEKGKKVERKATTKQTTEQISPLDTKKLIAEIKQQFKITNKLIRDTAAKEKQSRIIQPKMAATQPTKPTKFNTLEEYEEYQNKVSEAKDTLKYGGSGFGKKLIYGFRQGIFGTKYADKKARENAVKEKREEAARLLNPGAFQPSQSTQTSTAQQLNQQVKPAAQTQVDKPESNTSQTTNSEVVNNNTTQVMNNNTTENKIDTILQATKDIPTVKDSVERIEKRVSPRDITVGKGDDAQTFRFDPLAPEGKQVTEVKESGLAGSMASKEGGGRSDYEKVLSKAAYLGNEDLIEKKEQQDKQLNSEIEEVPAPAAQAAPQTIVPAVETPVTTPAPAAQAAPQTIVPAVETPVTTSTTTVNPQPVLPPPLPTIPAKQETPNFIKKLQEQADKLSDSKFVKELKEKTNQLVEKAANSNFVKNLQSRVSGQLTPQQTIQPTENIQVPEQTQSIQEPIVTEQPQPETQQVVSEIIPDVKPAAQTQIPNIESTTTEPTTSEIKTKEIETKLDRVVDSTKQIPEINDAVGRVEKRVSPRDITVGKGEEEQTLRFDPLAPEGKQVTQITKSGLSGGFADKTTAASVLSKAAYLGNADLSQKKQQEDLRKQEQTQTNEQNIATAEPTTNIVTPQIEAAPQVTLPAPEVAVATPNVAPQVQTNQQVAQKETPEELEQRQTENKQKTDKLFDEIKQQLIETKKLVISTKGITKQSKQNAQQDKPKFASVEEKDKYDEEVQKAKDVMQYGGTSFTKKFVYGFKAGILGEKFAKKSAAKNANKEEREKAFRLLNPDKVEPAEEKTPPPLPNNGENKTSQTSPDVKPTDATAVPNMETAQSAQQTSSPELEKKVDQVIQSTKDIPTVKDGVERIEKRVSPRDVTVGTGDQAQTYKFDPLAPQGKQVTEATESGLAGKFAGKKEEASVLSKAAYFGNQDLIAKKKQEDTRKAEAVETPNLMSAGLTPTSIPAIENTEANTEGAEAVKAVSIQREKAESEQEDRQKVIDKLDEIEKKLDQLLKKEEEDDGGGGFDLDIGRRGLGRAGRALGRAGRAIGRGARALGRGAASIGRGALSAARAAGPALGRAATTAARFLGPAAAVAGAGYTGYQVGQALDTGVEKLTGKGLSDRLASGVGALTGANAEQEAAVHSGESSFAEIQKRKNQQLKGTGYEMVAPGKYKGPDGKIVSAKELPPQVQSITKPGAMPNPQGVVEGKIQRPETAPAAPTQTPTTPVAAAASTPAVEPSEPATTAEASKPETTTIQPQARSQTPTVAAAVPVMSAVASQSRDKQQEEKITKLTSENAVLKSQQNTAIKRAAKVPRANPMPPPQQKKEKKEDLTVIQIRNVEQSVATYTASIFDHPVVHPGIYKM